MRELFSLSEKFSNGELKITKISDAYRGDITLIFYADNKLQLFLSFPSSIITEIIKILSDINPDPNFFTYGKNKFHIKYGYNNIFSNSFIELHLNIKKSGDFLKISSDSSMPIKIQKNEIQKLKELFIKTNKLLILI